MRYVLRDVKTSFEFRVSSFEFRVSSFEFRVSSFEEQNPLQLKAKVFSFTPLIFATRNSLLEPRPYPNRRWLSHQPPGRSSQWLATWPS